MSSMRCIKPLWILLVVLGLIAYVTCVGAAAPASAPASVTPSVYGTGETAFTVTLPTGWHFQGDVDGFAQFSGPAKSFLWVQRSRIRKTELGPDELPRYYTSKGYKLLYARKATIVSGLAGGRFILAKTDAGLEWRYDVTDAFVDGMQWVIFAVAPRTGFDKVSGGFVAIYSSIRLAASPKDPKAAKAGKQVQPQGGKAASTAAQQVKPPSSGGAKSEDTEAASSVRPTSPPEQPASIISLPKPSEAVAPSELPKVPVAAISLGKIAYEKGGQVWWDTPKPSGTPTSLGEGSMPRLSADGQYAVFKAKTGGWMVASTCDGKLRQVALDSKAEHVVISPDGTRLAYAVLRRYLFGPASSTVYVTDLSGKVFVELKDIRVEPRPTVGTGAAKILQADSCASPEFGLNSDILGIDARIAGVWSAVSVNIKTLQSQMVEAGGQGALPSPDGRKIAYSRVFVGERELWLCSTDGRLHEKLLSGVGDYAWAPDGSAILVERKGGIESVSVDSGVVEPFLDGAAHPASSVR